MINGIKALEAFAEIQEDEYYNIQLKTYNGAVFLLVDGHIYYQFTKAGSSIFDLQALVNMIRRDDV